MNQTIETMLEQANVPQRNEPYGFVTCAKVGQIVYNDKENLAYFQIKGDKIGKGKYVFLRYNVGTDLYDVSFRSKNGNLIKECNDLDFEQLPQYLWNETFIV